MQAQPSTAYQSEIEKRFPHILDNLILVWGFPEFGPFIEKLMINYRDARQGFPHEVMDELLFLHAVHELRSGGGGLSVTDPGYTR